MWRQLILLEIFFSIIANCDVQTKTSGSPWPLPQVIDYRSSPTSWLNIEPSSFHFVTSYKCDILQKALTRYRKLVFPQTPKNEAFKHKIGSHKRKNGPTEFSLLNIQVQLPCERFPYFAMNENYNLTVSSNGTGFLRSDTVWGALRGLETFSHLVYSPTVRSYRIRTATIADWPRFPHRGLLLDTSRHFVAVQSIMETLDLMAQNKLNVFHWHIVDDQSFPYQSTVFPELSKKGAYSSRHIYSRQDIKDDGKVINPSRSMSLDSLIIQCVGCPCIAHPISDALSPSSVLFEEKFDGHTESWGKGQSGLLTSCYNRTGKPTGKSALLDPSKAATWDFLLALFTEILQTFPDKYIHLGGDEVNYQKYCWLKNPEIKEWMELWGFTSASDIEKFYFKKARKDTAYLVWQEVLDNNLNVPRDTIAHVWKGDAISRNAELMALTRMGYKAILSSCWYLNIIKYGKDWNEFYACDPQEFNGTAEQMRLILGGELCMWGEFVDSTNITPRLWPRASAVAERLWSARHVNDVKTAAARLEEHRCRLVGRGYPVESINGPGFCPVEWPPRV